MRALHETGAGAAAAAYSQSLAPRDKDNRTTSTPVIDHHTRYIPSPQIIYSSLGGGPGPARAKYLQHILGTSGGRVCNATLSDRAVA